MFASRQPRSNGANFPKAAGIVFLAALFALPAAGSEARGIGGSWSGGGTVVYADGHRERARCHAHFSQSGPHVALNATCATPSGSTQQSARLHQTGPNSYSGSFFNPQYNVSGRIHINVHGNSQTVSLRSGSASASLTLRH